MIFLETLNDLRSKVNALEILSNQNEASKNYLDKVRDILSDIDESSSKSWIGFHANLYYEAFRKPPTWDRAFNSEWGSINGIPKYWIEKSYSDVEKQIKYKLSNYNLEEKELEINKLIKEAKKVNDDISTDLVIIQNNEKYTNECVILNELSDFNWGSSPEDIIDYRRPKEIMSRDAFAVMQGLRVPPHIKIDSDIVSLLSKLSSVENFIIKTKKLFRQLEVRSNYLNSVTNVEVTSNCIELISTLISKFHVVCRQLRSRHANRETIKINDEYDVQDLMHALLRLYFEDIRDEEWNPSYAGGSSRSDFLLKKEQIIIEIKKTRKSMSDRDIGEQLIIDIAKYKKHPDCKVLLCFVYDPEGIVGNPKGIEDDLNTMSTEEMVVQVMIEPK